MVNYSDETADTDDPAERPGDWALSVPGLAASVAGDDSIMNPDIQRDPAAAESGNGDGGPAGDEGVDNDAGAPAGGRR